MRVRIKTTNVDLSPDLESYVIKKIKSLEKFLTPILKKKDEVKGGGKEPRGEAYVEVGRPSTHHRKGDIYYAECTLPLPGKTLRAEAKEESIKKAVIEVKNDMQRRLKEYKGKKKAKDEKGRRKAKKNY